MLLFWFLSQKYKTYLNTILGSRPGAKAMIKGGNEYPKIIGTINFYQTKDGVLLTAEVINLPHRDNTCTWGIFGFHIHEGGSCTGNTENPFADTKMHYNPKNCAHPHHAGDLPPLFENNGRAFMVFLTDRFTISEIIGKTIVIHISPDDFKSQPAGDAGKKIACGEIK
jgi:Cu-Zn family superoxide dismutase